MLYRAWCGEHKISMRQTHYAGEKLFVDYAGHTIPIYNKSNDEVVKAQIFIAVLGASNYTYAEATMTQELSNWISSNVRAFEFLGGVPKIVVPDNLKSAIAKPCRYEPDINLTYLQMAQHYNIAVIPARTYKPKDKAKVEGGVLIVSRWILARLRNHKFYSLAELNAVIRSLLDDLNNRPFKNYQALEEALF
jgi:Transposase and inactivated derivatives